jgi:hypothetical protein
MAKILETLKGINAYPVPLRTLTEIAEGRGLNLQDEATLAVLRSSGYKLATADILLWLSLAPNISQGGQSYSFSEEQRLQLRKRADTLFGECEDEASLSKPKFGYKGKKL